MQSLSRCVEGNGCARECNIRCCQSPCSNLVWKQRGVNVSAHFVVQDAEGADSRDCTGVTNAARRRALTESRFRLSTLQRDPVLCASSGNPDDGNPFSNSLLFQCTDADVSFAGFQTTERYATTEGRCRQRNQ